VNDATTAKEGKEGKRRKRTSIKSATHSSVHHPQLARREGGSSSEKGEEK